MSEAAFHSPITGAFVHAYRPLRVYVYLRPHWPPQALCDLARLLVQGEALFQEGRHLFVRVMEPDQADLILVGCDLNYYERREETLRAELELLPGNEERHLLVDHRDSPELAISDRAIHLKPSVHRRSLAPNVICVPYLETVDNFFPWYLEPRPPLRYELSLIADSSPVRARFVSLLEGRAGRTCFKLRDGFFHEGLYQYGPPRRSPLTAEERRARREEHIQVSLQSRYVLAARGWGLNSFRFYEALSLGVPPILVSSDCALPFSDRVDYPRFCVSVEEDDPGAVEAILAALEIDDARYAEMCRQARLHYDTWLSPRSYLFLLHQALLGALRRTARGAPPPTAPR